MVGLGDEEIADSRRGVSPDRKTEAALEFARKVVTERGWVSDDDVASLRAAGATDVELAEIVGVVALNIFSNYFNHVAGTEVDFPEVEGVGQQARMRMWLMQPLGRVREVEDLLELESKTRRKHDESCDHYTVGSEVRIGRRTGPRV